MRIGIVGAGAVGGFLAGHLARAGTEVALLARGPHLAALRERGLTVESRGERWTVTVPASDRAADLGAVDAVVVTAKAPALPAIAAKYLGCGWRPGGAGGWWWRWRRVEHCGPPPHR